jgi:hypothetical protein
LWQDASWWCWRVQYDDCCARPLLPPYTFLVCSSKLVTAMLKLIWSSPPTIEVTARQPYFYCLLHQVFQVTCYVVSSEYIVEFNVMSSVHNTLLQSRLLQLGKTYVVPCVLSRLFNLSVLHTSWHIFLGRGTYWSIEA